MKNVAYPLLLFFIILQACESDEKLKTEYLDLPAVPFDYQRTENDNAATLGRVLFYDRQLSLNNSVSCSSCHKQTFAFSDNVAKSVGFENKLTDRNSMPIQNIDNFGVGFPGFQFLFWDGRETSLTQMVMKPIVNHIEMGFSDLDELSAKLSEVPYYKTLFTNAYGSDEITKEKIADALSTFLMQITSMNTAFDDGTLTALQTEGMELFSSRYNCNECHQVQDPHGYINAGTFANIGLDEVYDDEGLRAVTQSVGDIGRFKIPSLRNVTLTGPYMHDGRFNTLEEVLDHYSEGIADHPSLDPKLRGSDGKPLRLSITAHEKDAIIAFLHSFTDYSMISDPKFSNPFNSR